jgi:hypothetical protein
MSEPVRGGVLFGATSLGALSLGSEIDDFSHWCVRYRVGYLVKLPGEFPADT